MRVVGRVAVAAVVTALSILAAECGVRWTDGWPLWGRLPLAEHAVDEATARAPMRPDRAYVATIPRAVGVESDWYEEQPAAQPRIPMTPDLAARAARYASYPYDAFTVWNRAFLQRQVCAGLPRPMQTPRVAHPNLAGNPRQLVSLDSVRARCH